MSKLRGYKTIGFFLLTAVAYLLAWPTLTTYVDPQVIAVATSVVGIVLRYLTTTPVAPSLTIPGKP